MKPRRTSTGPVDRIPLLPSDRSHAFVFISLQFMALWTERAAVSSLADGNILAKRVVEPRTCKVMVSGT